MYTNEEAHKIITRMMREFAPETLISNDWLQFTDITEEERAKYPAAKEAYDIQNSPLMKALK